MVRAGWLDVRILFLIFLSPRARAAGGPAAEIRFFWKYEIRLNI